MSLLYDARGAFSQDTPRASHLHCSKQPIRLNPWTVGWWCKRLCQISLDPAGPRTTQGPSPRRLLPKRGLRVRASVSIRGWVGHSLGSAVGRVDTLSNTRFTGFTYGTVRKTTMKGHKSCTAMMLGGNLISENYQSNQRFKGRFGAGSKHEYASANFRCFTLPGVRFPRLPPGHPICTVPDSRFV